MAGINYEGTNLVGAPFKPYVDQQISRRQELLGTLDKTSEQIVWENGNTAWVRLASSINIENSKTPVASFSSETACMPCCLGPALLVPRRGWPCSSLLAQKCCSPSPL